MVWEETGMETGVVVFGTEGDWSDAENGAEKFWILWHARITDGAPRELLVGAKRFCRGVETGY